MEIYHNPRCRKSRETLNILQDAEVDYEIRKYLDDPPTKEELTAILEKLDVRPLTLIRKGEPIFKNEFKGKDLSDDEWIEVMVANPRLIERPIVIDGDRAIVGRPPENVRDLL